MPEPALTIHGPNASETATDFIIKKADLPTLNPAANNSGESLVVGMTNLWVTTLPEEGFATDYSRQIKVVKGTPYITTGNDGKIYINTDITITLREELIYTTDADNF